MQYQFQKNRHTTMRPAQDCMPIMSYPYKNDFFGGFISGTWTAETARSDLQAEKSRLIRIGEKRLNRFLYNIGAFSVSRILGVKLREMFPDTQRLFQHGFIHCQTTDFII